MRSHTSSATLPTTTAARLAPTRSRQPAATANGCFPIPLPGCCGMGGSAQGAGPLGYAGLLEPGRVIALGAVPAVCCDVPMKRVDFSERKRGHIVVLDAR